MGSGLAYSYVAIFLAARTQGDLFAVATYFMVVAAANLATAVALSAFRMTLSPGKLGGSGYAVLAVAYAALGAVHGLPMIAVIGAFLGIGRGLSTAGVAPFTGQLVPVERRRDAFARRYRAMNVGIGIGSLCASLMLTLAPSAMWVLLILNGLSFVPVAGFMLACRPQGKGEERPAADSPNSGAPHISVRRLILLAGPVAAMQLAVNGLGYSQFESTAPLVAHRLSGTSLGFVSLVVAANTIAVIVMQRPIVRWLKHLSPSTGMQATFALWAAAYAAGGVTSLLAAPLPEVGFLMLGVVFAGGEAAYSCSFHPLLLSSVPAQDATRASSLSNAMASIGTSVGPSMGVLLMSAGHAVLVWTALATGCGAVMLLSGRVKYSDRGVGADA